MNKIVFLIVLMVTASSSFGQSQFVLYDAENDRVGTLLGFDQTLGVIATVYTPDGYLINVDTVSGLVTPSMVVYFATAECTGQAYMIAQVGSDTKWAKRGGGLFNVAQPHIRHAKIEWSPPVVLADSTFTGGQCWRNDDCGGSPRDCSGLTELVPVTLVNDADYGLGLINPGDGHGFLPPITGKVEPSEGSIFCDGFESCPAQP